jgi:hypothetical protein
MRMEWNATGLDENSVRERLKTKTYSQAERHVED